MVREEGGGKEARRRAVGGGCRARQWGRDNQVSVVVGIWDGRMGSGDVGLWVERLERSRVRLRSLASTVAVAIGAKRPQDVTGSSAFSGESCVLGVVWWYGRHLSPGLSPHRQSANGVRGPSGCPARPITPWNTLFQHKHTDTVVSD